MKKTKVKLSRKEADMTLGILYTNRILCKKKERKIIDKIEKKIYKKYGIL